ncbi:hypothetical protein GCM10010324_63390 [Streptomyces hiroshimensis]|uniref:Lipoprotein n=1 Tax=Streptomyces hiroshimensis TaxID=66424 RepID=A0ABQ2ZBX8_9ACTN|nr:hypothetical protein GCM10010324_63390 [Streptomyces hiroshimensis]
MRTVTSAATATATATAAAVLALLLTGCAGGGGSAEPDERDTPFRQGRQFGIEYREKLRGHETEAQARTAARRMCREGALVQAADGGEEDWFRACVYAVTEKHGGVPYAGSVREVRPEEGAGQPRG